MKANSVVITAIIALVILECVALYMGINGTLFAMVVAIIAGLAGWRVPIKEVKGGSDYGK